jgi:hypothetical protein
MHGHRRAGIPSCPIEKHFWRKLMRLTLPIFAVALTVMPVAMQAQLGIPGVPTLVTDPINRIQLIYENGTLLQQVAETVSLLNLAYQESQALKNKQFMLAATYLNNFAMQGAGVGHSSWTIGLTTAGGMVPANLVWQDMASSSFQGNPTGTIQNRIQLADSMGPSMIDSIGGCNASLFQTDTAIGALESMAFSNDIGANSSDALAGISGVGHTQTLRLQECAHNVQLQQAQVVLVDLLRQRDYENTQFNTYQNIDLFAGNSPGINNVSGILTATFQ